MKKHRDTISAHAQKVVLGNEPLTLPIFQTSTYRFESPEALEKYVKGDDTQYLYSRYENPTVRAVQEKIALLEKGESCFVFSSGMAAITSTILAFLKSGDELIASDSLYGRSQLFIENWLPRFGVKTRLIPLNEFPNIDRYFSPQTKIVYIESPTNPTLRVIDVAATAAKTHEHNALLLMDGTFATPINQNPLELGADVVMHSVTKYLAGHSDIIAGASVFAKKHEKAIRESIRTFGGTVDPFAAFLLERGLKTLPIRVERQNRTAQFLAERLAEHPKVKRVNYPGLRNHPGHDVAAKQMRGFGGMLSFDVENYQAAASFLRKLDIIAHAASLGGVETLVSLPILTSHYGQPPKNLAAAGISEGTIRISVGLEHPDDLWGEISASLAS